ncbi:TIR domain-containing protein [Mariniflexile sp.]|uniref:TIR domain-containing protein n=1 Tax=Mariniflexile sp. TaxID=1979402 RepID=UPI003562DB99
MDSENTIFFSYSRDDSEFVLDLAKNLRQAGAKIWLDQLDIKPGARWDSSIEKALAKSKTLLVVLSEASVISHNVMDEVSYALEENKAVVPILMEKCEIPFRLRRLQYADFSGDYKTGVKTLIDALNLDKEVAKNLADVTTDKPAKPIKKKEERITQPPHDSEKPQNFIQDKNNQKPPKTWLVESIIVTLFCCLPLGIVGIINATKVESRFYAGDLKEANRYSADAKKWTTISFWTGLVIWVLYIFAVASGIVNEY